MDISLSDIANYAQIASIPLTIFTWFFTRDRFAKFWEKWFLLILFFVVIVGIIGLSKLGFLKWLQYQSTWPVWGLILLALSGLTILSLILFLKSLLSKKPDYINYVSDTIFQVIWHWDYVSGKLYDDEIVPLCPRCSYHLDPARKSGYRIIDNVTLVCDHCGFEKEFDCNWTQLRRRVVKEIDRYIRTGEYKQRLNQ